jgi:hypothetical protein
MSSIQGALLDVWEDLRARRMLPVAALLLAALVAVPLLLSKGSETPEAPVPESVPTQSNQPKGPEALAQVKLDELEAGTGSSLSGFDASNPFSPPEKVIEAAQEEEQGDTTTPITGGETPTTPGTAPDTGGAPTGDTGGEGTETTTTEFTYVLDVTFWNNGRKRQIKGMEKLDVLPGEANPQLIFMGTTTGGGNAVFLVDSTLTTTGEGTCKPDAENCATLELGAGSEAEFTNETGGHYRLRIDQIRRVKVEDQSGDAGPAKHEKRTATAAVGPEAPVRQFEPLAFADIVVVTEQGKSSGDEKRR